jgi:hypothetical protein
MTTRAPRGRRAALRIRLAALGLLVAAVTALLPITAGSAAATGPSTIFMADQPQHAQVYVENLAITAYQDSNPGYLDLMAQTASDNSNPVGILLAAVGGETLRAGTYDIERDWPASPNFDRLYVFGNHIGCSGAGATVVIHEISWQADTLMTLSMSIVCPVEGGDTAAIELRFHVPGAIPAHATSADQLAFPRVLAGTSDPVQTVTVTSLGPVALDEAPITLTGSAAADYAITTDSCSGATVDQGETCSIGIKFTPIDGPTFDRTAWLTIHDNTLNGYRTVKLMGLARRPTTITLSSTNNPATLPDTPTTITPTIVPSVPSGRIDWYVNGVYSSFTFFGGVSDGAIHPNVAGTRNISATFVGTDLYAPSSSNTLEQVVHSTSTISLVADPAASGADRFDVTATVTAPGSQPYGGTLTIWDDTTSTKIGEAVLNNVTYLDLPSLIFTGTHDLRATFSGVAPNILPSTASITVNGPPPSAPQAPTSVSAVAGEAAATISWSTDPSGNSPTGFVATSNPGGQTCSTTEPQCIVGGLTAGTPYTFTVRASNDSGSSSPSSSSNEVTPFALDLPIGTISIAGGASYSASPSVTLSVPATDAGSGVALVALSNDGASWTTRTYAPTQAWTLPATNGTRSVWAKWQDGAGNWSDPVSDGIVLDTTVPTAIAPSWSIASGSALVAGKATLRLKWSGSDATSGIGLFELAQSTDGGAYAPSASQAPVTIDRLASLGHTYRFRVRAIDRAGNIGPWTYGPTTRLSGISQTDMRVHYHGSWTSVSSSTTWWGGTARSSSTAGSTVSYTFTGKSVAWVGLKAATRGKADIYINGVRKATIDLYSTSTLKQRIIWSATYASSATRTITIKVLGTGGRPRVDIDGFITGT